MVLVLIAVGVVIKPNKTSVCKEGTSYGECSSIKPYYCEEGILVENASVCGCSNVSVVSGDFCFSYYQNRSQDISLRYILRGEEEEINFTAYSGMYNYVSEITREIYYGAGETPSRGDFKLKSINEEKQRELLLPLVIKILNTAKNRDDAVRIAVSIVQNIPYGFSNKTTIVIGNLEANYSRYPYEVLYEQKGVCGEKSALLAFLLKEMGYNVSFFYFSSENHEAIGIKCPLEESFGNTGYCFIETTAPAVINDGSIEYVGGITLDSQPEIIPISEGSSIEKGWYEYQDADVLEKIREGKFVLLRDLKLNKIIEKYGLVEEYHPA